MPDPADVFEPRPEDEMEDKKEHPTDDPTRVSHDTEKAGDGARGPELKTLNELSKLRRNRKSAVTKYIGKLIRHVAEENIDNIKTSLSTLKASFAQLEESQDRYMDSLNISQAADKVIDDAEIWFINAESEYVATVRDAMCMLHDLEKPLSNQVRNETEKVTVAPACCESTRHLPKVKLDTFSGDPADYQTFMAVFDELVHNSKEDGQVKLSRLLEYTTGPAKQAIKSTALIGGEIGYASARKILEARFGEPNLIAQKIIGNLKSGIKVATNTELQQLADDLVSAEAALTKLGMLNEVDNQSSIQEILTRCRSYVSNKWRRKAIQFRKDTKTYPGFGEFVKLIISLAEDANDPVYPQSIPGSHKDGACSTTDMQHVHGATFQSTFSRVDTAVRNPLCLVCKQSHRIFECTKFKSMNTSERFKVAQDNRLCFNCLYPGHRAAECRKPLVCTVNNCNRKHSKFLHAEPRENSISNNTPRSEPGTENNIQGNLVVDHSNVTVFSCDAFSRVYLPVVPITINGHYKTHALLDNASTNTLLTEDLACKLKLTGKDVKYRLRTVGHESDFQSHLYSFDISGVGEEFSDCVNVKNVVSVPSIPTRYPEDSIDVRAYPYLADVPILYHEGPIKVEVLIGMDNACLLMPLQVRSDPESKSQIYASKTKLGWSLSGPVFSNPQVPEICTNHVSLQERIESLWHLENDDDSEAMSQDDKRVLALWDEQTEFTDGHFVIPIPFRDECPQFPMNKGMAMKRLHNLLHRLKKNGLYDRYRGEVDKLLNDGYVEMVPDDELDLNDGTVWYIPHTYVMHAEKDKMRIVFDCRAQMGGVSFNNQCLGGPDLNNKLVDVLLAFRENVIGLMGDVTAMYLQVRIPTSERNCMRFMFEIDGKIVHLRSTSHLFGGVFCASSSIYALRRAAANANASTLISDTIRDSFYIDDLLKSVLDAEAGREIYTGTKRALKDGGGFELGKFVTNSPELLETIEEADRAKVVKEITNDPILTKALGIRWHVSRDMFYYVSNIVIGTKPITRRSILSQVASLYDSLGLIIPVVITGRMIMQDVTRLKMGWDEPVSSDIVNLWTSWVSSLDALRNIEFPRCVVPAPYTDSAHSLHVFCDASSKAYGACCYLRSVNAEGRISVNLLAAKGRLAPCKQITIPRMELCAAVEAVKLSNLVTRALTIPVIQVFFWGDSQIVLSYIRNDSKRFRVFVANRISFIRQHTSPVDWNFVRGTENPSDVITRGCDANSMPDTWFRGPDFLHDYRSNWPVHEVNECDLTDDVEIKVCATDVVTEKEHPLDALSRRFSSFYRLNKALCWLLRFKTYLREKTTLTGPITVTEMKEAEMILFKHVQQSNFEDELETLNEKGSVKCSSRMLKLSPMLRDDIIVVGGRLHHANLSDEAKNPIILPGDDPVTRSIILDYHNHAHLGLEWTLCRIRRRFWITKCRNIIKGIQRACVVCKRLFALPRAQRMANLPPERLMSGVKPFQFTGCDVFGHFIVKRGRSDVKRYGCVFSCMVTRACHIEMLPSLESNALIQALVRFTARRGTVSKIFCDNGTNLVGACGELSRCFKALDRSKIIQDARRRDIEWNFNPPHASNQGGHYERVIRTIRKVLLGVMRSCDRLDDDALNTFFSEAEAIVNSRPIVKVSDDANDEAALTPNHILLGAANPSLIWGKFELGDAYRKQWKFVQMLANTFWKQWVAQYVPQLQERQKWHKQLPNFKVGDLVLISDEVTPRSLWPLGLVTQVNVGRDGLVRSCRMRSKHAKELVRPVNKLVMLEGCIEN